MLEIFVTMNCVKVIMRRRNFWMFYEFLYNYFCINLVFGEDYNLMVFELNYEILKN